LFNKLIKCEPNAIDKSIPNTKISIPIPTDPAKRHPLSSSAANVPINAVNRFVIVMLGEKSNINEIIL